MKVNRSLFLMLTAMAALHAPAAYAANESKTSEREEALRERAEPDSRRRADGTIQVEPKEKRVSPYANAQQKEKVEKERQRALESKSDKEERGAQK